MARIYKGSKYHLQLLITKNSLTPIKEISISFYTTNPATPVVVNDNYVIKANIVDVVIDSTTFDTLDEGLVSYVIYGTREDGMTFIEDRQSSYYLMGNSSISEDVECDNCPECPDVPDNPECPDCPECPECPDYNFEYIGISEDVSNYINENGDIVVTPSKGYDAIKRVSVTIGPATSPGYMLALHEIVGYNFMYNWGMLASYVEYDYLPSHGQSLEGVFDEYEKCVQYVIESSAKTEDYDKCLMAAGPIFSECTDMSRMYTGNGTIPFITFEMDCSNVVKCDDAFKGFDMLSYCHGLHNLGYSFDAIETLDITPTRLNNANIGSLAKSLHNFKQSPNKTGWKTANIKGVEEQYRKYFTDRGWTCID